MSELRVHPDRPRLQLLGDFALAGAEGATLELPNRRGRAALAYLYLARDQTATRQQLCGLFWSDRGEAQARASLRQCLLSLREDLAGLDRPIIDIGRDRISLHGAEVTSDVAELRAALDEEDCDLSTSLLNRIGRARLLQDLELPGLFEDWLLQTRSEFERSLASRVQAWVERLRTGGRWQEVRALAQAYLDRDELDELLVGAAIRAEIALGAPAAAHRRFRALKAALDREFGAAPGAAVREAMALLDGISAPNDKAGPPVEAPRKEADGGGLAIDSAPSHHRASTPHADVLGGGRPTVAVLSFDQRLDEPDKTYLAQGIAEDIANALSKFKWLFVLSPQSSLLYDRAHADMKQIRRDLGVRYIVTGNAVSSGSKLRLTIALCDCLLGDTVWTHPFVGSMEQVFDMTDETIATIVGALEPALSRREEEVVACAPPRNLQHWDLFIRGRWHFWRLSYGNIQRSQALLKEAAALKPNDSASLSFLAFTHFVQLWSGWAVDRQASLGEAMSCSTKAVTVAPDDAFAHYTLGTMLTLIGDLDRAISEQNIALGINPNLAGAMGELGRCHAFSGDYEEALVWFDRAIRTSPSDPQRFLWLRHKAVAAFVVHRLGEAVGFAKDAVACRGDVALNYYLLAAILAADGDVDGGGKALAEARRLLPSHSMETLKFSNPFRRLDDLRRYTDALTLCGWIG